MAATATSSFQNPAAASDAGNNPLQTQIRLHEVAIAELKCLSASRVRSRLAALIHDDGLCLICGFVVLCVL
ncbi:hypothetical protein AKJ16_DCAP13307 [Drosera capensis]